MLGRWFTEAHVDNASVDHVCWLFKKNIFWSSSPKKAAVQPLGRNWPQFLPVKPGLKVGNDRHCRSCIRWVFWCAVALWRRHDGPFGLLRLQQWKWWSLNGMFVSVRSRSLYLCNLYCVFCTPLLIFFAGWTSFAQVSSRWTSLKPMGITRQFQLALSAIQKRPIPTTA